MIENFAQEYRCMKEVWVDDEGKQCLFEVDLKGEDYEVVIRICKEKSVTDYTLTTEDLEYALKLVSNRTPTIGIEIDTKAYEEASKVFNDADVEDILDDGDNILAASILAYMKCLPTSLDKKVLLDFIELREKFLTDRAISAPTNFKDLTSQRISELDVMRDFIEKGSSESIYV